MLVFDIIPGVGEQHASTPRRTRLLARTPIRPTLRDPCRR